MLPFGKQQEIWIFLSTTDSEELDDPNQWWAPTAWRESGR
jgi:hypothetical protein